MCTWGSSKAPRFRFRAQPNPEPQTLNPAPSTLNPEPGEAACRRPPGRLQPLPRPPESAPRSARNHSAASVIRQVRWRGEKLGREQTLNAQGPSRICNESKEEEDAEEDERYSEQLGGWLGAGWRCWKLRKLLHAQLCDALRLH